MHTITWMNPGSNTFGGRSQTQKATSRVNPFVQNSSSGTRTDGSRRELPDLGQGRGGDCGGSAWVRDGVGTVEAPPGSGKEWGPQRLHLGQAKSGDHGGSAWVREGVGTAGARPGDRGGSAWGREQVGTPMAVWTFSH